MYQHDYKQDREWADSYEDQVLHILTGLMPHLVMLYVASDEKDKKQATDFEVKMKGGSIAVRLRDMKECRWRELTLRSRRVSKETGEEVKTELAKIKEGYGFRYFYGWIDENGIIAEWMLVDLHKVRLLGLLDNKRPEIPNRDGKTWFITISRDELRDAGCLLAESPQRQRHVNTQVTQEDRDEGDRRAAHRKYHKPKIEQQGPGLWDEVRMREEKFQPIDIVPPSPVPQHTPLTLTTLNRWWRTIQYRIKTHGSAGSRVAALTNNLDTECVVTEREPRVIVLRALAMFHYSALSQPDIELIEWAIKTEFQQECKVRLLSPQELPDWDELPHE